MHNVDLSYYAGLFIFGIFTINILLAVAGYKMKGKESAIASEVLAVIGMWIGLGIVKVMDFDNATPETVITLGIFLVLLSSIYILYVFSNWLKNVNLKNSNKMKIPIEKKSQGLNKKLVNAKIFFT